MENKPEKVWIKFYKPSEIKTFEIPSNYILVGDAHIQRGSFCIIGGPPGVGKSRAAMALAIAGATGNDWFGLNIKNKFKTFIVQNENGKNRLKKDFATVNCDDLDEWIRICTPPPLGMAFDDMGFIAALYKAIEEFKPDLLIFDPWNAIAGDDKQTDYLKAFDKLRSLVGDSDTAPAIVIIAHTRKPRDDEKASGRELIHLLSGSHVLVSVPRSVFVMVPESADVDNDKIIWTCCKNNDGVMDASTIWTRIDLGFEYVGSVDPKKETQNKRVSITHEHLRKTFTLADGGLPKKLMIPILKRISGASESACYAALETDGKFKDNLKEENGMLVWHELEVKT